MNMLYANEAFRCYRNQCSIAFRDNIKKLLESETVTPMQIDSVAVYFDSLIAKGAIKICEQDAFEAIIALVK